jgi:antirestriction protein
MLAKVTKQLKELDMNKSTFIKKYGKVGKAVRAKIDNNLEKATTMMEVHYSGLHDSAVSYVKFLIADTYNLENLDDIKDYIDYEKMAKDWFRSDYTAIAVGKKVAVFSTY